MVAQISGQVLIIIRWNIIAATPIQTIAGCSAKIPNNSNGYQQHDCCETGSNDTTDGLAVLGIMALKVKAVERLLKFDKESAGKYRYVMKADLYTSLTQAKVIKEAAMRSGVSQGVMKACWDAAGEVIKAWATEGHSVALPGLGSMRFGLRSKAVEKVEDVKTSLITSRRIIFTPSVDLKDELASTAIQITCIDRNGDEVKRVTSTSGDVEDPEQENENANGSSQGGSSDSGSGSGNNNGNTNENGELGGI